MPAIPRLPTVTATVPPGLTRRLIPLPRIAPATARGTSSTSGWLAHWRTPAIGGNPIGCGTLGGKSWGGPPCGPSGLARRGRSHGGPCGEGDETTTDAGPGPASAV